MRMTHWWNYTDRGNRSAWHETCPRATLRHMELSYYLDCLI